MLGGATLAYGLCRPPGHHAARSMYGGYCFFNNAAIAAQAIIAARPASGSRSSTSTTTTATAPSRSSGGAATSATSRSTPTRRARTRTSSAAPTRPGRATGAGENLNIPLPAGATDDDYLEATDRALEAIGATPGSIVVVSLGFDTYGLDPIGDFALTTRGLPRGAAGGWRRSGGGW